MPPDWAASFERVDRALFLPGTMWPFDAESGRSRAVIKADDPVEWHRCADADLPITTQWDDGNVIGNRPGTAPTSSASMPSVVMSMLRDLEVRDDAKVLEVGTGTGWNAGLLTHRLGGKNVTTIEVDPTVVRTARQALHNAGLRPRVLEGDGFRGVPTAGYYDRVIVTCGLRTIAAAWVRQAQPGGLIVAPWGTPYSNQDAVVRLTVLPDGTAQGRFTGPARFMTMRSQRTVWPRHEDYVPSDWAERSDRSTTEITAQEFSSGAFDIAEFVTGLRVRECVHINAGAYVWFYGLRDRSWAAVRFATQDSTGDVYQSGARPLWDEVLEARAWWTAAGRPGFERFGLTTGPDGQHPWLDSPANPL